LTTAHNLFSLTVIVTLLFAGCGDDSDRQASQPPGEVEQELSQFSLVRTRRGQTKWKLSADTATFLESDRVKIEGVELLIFGDKDGGTLTIHGDEGEVNQRTDDIKIMGNVEGVSSDGGRLAAEEIYWRDGTGKIYTLPGIEVTITYEDSVIVGEELEADPELETVELKNITGITRPEEKESEKPAGESTRQRPKR
jgi:LPS export ABC transporter protein LptC